MDPRIHVDYRQLLSLKGALQGLSLLPRSPSASPLAGQHGSRFRGRGLDFEELRHYRDGDDIRTLDWKVTLRTGKPHVRVFTEERDRSVLILADQRQSLFFASQVTMKSVVAARLASLLGWRALADGDRVGMLLLTDSGCDWFEPQRQSLAWMRALARLAKANQALGAGRADSQPQQLEQALAALQRRQLKAYTLVLISDFDGWQPGCLTRIRHLQRHNEVLTCYLTDPMEQQLPGPFVASDGQQQMAVDPASASLSQRFAEAAADKATALQRAFARRGLPLLQIDTGGDEVGQLKRALGRAS
ncbi:DUF58 domain-containing protein [Ferrimonas marina]|uniref:DUF58 domain-containing protein n=1 Tax=Ferrimonas marina TaxID=299255 RepID=A0A1M5VED6_9GAMM|nr:DUF58 domain-containing protein [Ferrimonas marina]SHH73535.1 Protein of unknown function DUF58 [Ferrimonas marina]